jgi:NAD(P)-dependent dehydrogenase (short-subunit alcohol dehydrogenase family)
MRTVVITGANAGLGFQTASTLARMGARVVMACRNLEKARKARSDLLAEVQDAEATILPLDVADPTSIRDFGRELADRTDGLDVLINNAGVVALPLTRNRVGHEMQLVTNYLGAFELTGTLLPLFRSGVPARIVNVGSLAHRFAKLDLDDLNWEKTPYSQWKAYARSKLAMVTFTMELNRRLQQRGSPILALGAHPGFAATDIGRHSSLLTPRNPVGRWFNRTMEKLLVPTAAQASMSIVHAACSPDARGGDYFGPTGFQEIRGEPGVARVNPIAKDVELGRRLWAASESMTGVRYLSEAGCSPEDAAASRAS